MNSIIHEKSEYSFAKGLERARKRIGYYEESLFIETSARIVQAMNNLGITRSALARRMNVSPAYITKILRGHANLSLESLAKLAFALDMKWECFLVQKRANITIFEQTADVEQGWAHETNAFEETATVEDRTPSSMPDETDFREECHYELRHTA
jgi:transcriptional regulator with XRE-family HTH domain